MKLKTANYLPFCLWIAIATACSAQPSPEELKLIEELRDELESIRTEIGAAEKKNAALAGGLVKALVEARLEILKTTEALVQQRIHAIESGAKIDVAVKGAEPDPELAQALEAQIAEQQEEVEEARREAARYSGGLVAAMKGATLATSEQTLAMLKQRYLSAKYGLLALEPLTASARTESEGGSPSAARDYSEGLADSTVAQEIVDVRLLRKRFTEQDYQEYIFFDIEFTASGLDKASRAIKGVLHLQDLFGEPRMNINWTIDVPIAPGQSTTERGMGFEFNQFIDSHQWVRSTDLENMTASMTVTSVLYQDGTRLDL